jgi:hypothetical protein
VAGQAPADTGVMTIDAISESLGSIPFEYAHATFTAKYDTERIAYRPRI